MEQLSKLRKTKQNAVYAEMYTVVLMHNRVT